MLARHCRATVRAVAAAAIVTALAACRSRALPDEAREQHAARADGDVVVAVAWPWKAQRGMRFLEGLQLAANEVNASGGIRGRRLRLLQVDDQGSVNEGLLVAQRLAADPRVMAVIGHLQSYVTVPASSIYDYAGLPVWAPAATAPELTVRGYPRVFRGTVTDLATGRQMAEFAAGRGYRDVAIYYVRNSYGRALANAFEEHATSLGLNVAARASHDPNHRSAGRRLEAAVSDWGGMDLDAIFLAGEAPVAGYLIAALRASGITVPILGSDAMSSPSLLHAGGSALEGTIVPSFFHPDEPRGEARRFVAAFRRSYGVTPDAGAALGYDAVHVLAHAMRKSGSASPEMVSATLHRLRAYPGVTGPFAFDKHGDLLSRRLTMTEVRDGGFRYYRALPSTPPRTAR